MAMGATDVVRKAWVPFDFEVNYLGVVRGGDEVDEDPLVRRR